jgi:hypothetical protein
MKEEEEAKSGTFFSPLSERSGEAPRCESVSIRSAKKNSRQVSEGSCKRDFEADGFMSEIPSREPVFEFDCCNRFWIRR